VKYGAEEGCWTDHVENEVVRRVNEDWNVLYTTRRRKTKWIGHVLRSKLLLKNLVEEKIKRRIKVMGRRERGSKQLLDDFQKRRRYCKLKEEALNCTQ
jgi:hypothetical protein